MLTNAGLFLHLALLAGVVGFGLPAGPIPSVAQAACLFFLVLFVIALLGGARPTNPPPADPFFPSSL